MGPQNDLTGKVINGCKIIKLLERRDKTGKYFWLVECHCGNLFEMRGNCFVTGKTKSCGCSKTKINIKDLTGQSFNNLKIISNIGKKKISPNYHYLVECFCGKLFEARGSDIKRGHTKSCGCLNYIEYKNVKFRSVWEVYLSIYLTSKRIEWEYEKQMYVKIDGKLVKYYPDFYLPEQNKYLEVKGYKYLKGLVKSEALFNQGYNIDILKQDELEAFMGIKINKLNYIYATGGFDAVEKFILNKR